MFALWQRVAITGTRRTGGNYTVRLTGTNPIAKSEQRPLLSIVQAASQLP